MADQMDQGNYPGGYQLPSMTARVEVDSSGVQQAIQAIQQAAQSMSSSVGAFSSNVLGNMADSQQRMAAAGMGGGQGGFSPGLFTASAIPNTMMNVMMAQQGAGAMSPQAAVARDALMMQYNAMGPSNGFGPALTTPYGDPTMNLFRQQAQAGSFNTGFNSSWGPPGAPGDMQGSRGGGFLRGPGGGMDMAGMFAHQALFGRGAANDNLEDLMVRNLERRQEAFGSKVTQASRWGLSNGLGSMGMSALGGMAGRAFGSVGGIAGSVLGGFVGDKIGGSIDATISHFSRPFDEAASDFRQYTAPYIRGDRVGNGQSFHDSMETQKKLTKKMTSDSWFTANEYQDLIRMSGESGLFKFTGDKDSALKAVDHLGESVKTLYSLGVKSREMLKQIDASVGTFGLDPRNPQAMASFYSTMAVTAQSAGKTNAQMAEMVAPAAQMFGAQGLGFKTGAEMAAYHQAQGGAGFRSGRMGAMENTYYGGPEGFGNALTQGTAAAFRTPIGEAAIMSMFGGDMRNLTSVLGGKGLSVNDIVDGSSRIANDDPEKFKAMQARLPWLMKNVPGEKLDQAFIKMAEGTYRDMTGESGKIDSLKFMTHLMSAYNQDATSANARIDQIAGFKDSAADMQRSARDQYETQRMEGLRRPGLQRRFDKYIEGTLGVFASGISTGMNSFGHGISENIDEAITGVHRFRLGESGMRGVDPLQLGSELEQGQAELRKAGFTPTTDYRKSLAGTYQENLTKVGNNLLNGDRNAMDAFAAAGREAKLSGSEMAMYTQLATKGKVDIDLGTLKKELKDQLQSTAENVTGLTGGDASKSLLGDKDQRARFNQALKAGGLSSGYGDLYLGQDGEGKVVKQVTVDRDSVAFGDRRMIDKLQGGQVKDSDRVGVDEEVNRQRAVRLLSVDPGKRSEIAKQLLSEGMSQGQIDSYMEQGGVTGWVQRKTIGQVALTNSQVGSMNGIANKYINETQDFQLGHRGFIRGAAEYDMGDNKGLKSTQTSIALDLISSGKHKDILNALSSDKGASLDAVAKIMFPDMKPEEIGEQQHRMIAGVLSAIKQHTGDMTPEQSKNLDSLLASKIDIGNAQGMNLQELEKRHGEIVDSMHGMLGGGSKGFQDFFQGASDKDSDTGAEIGKRLIVAKMMTSSSSKADFMARLSKKGITAKQLKEEYGVSDSMMDDFDKKGGQAAAGSYKLQIATMQNGLSSEGQKSMDMSQINDDIENNFGATYVGGNGAEEDMLGHLQDVQGIAHERALRGAGARLDPEHLSLLLGKDKIGKGQFGLGNYGVGGEGVASFADRFNGLSSDGKSMGDYQEMLKTMSGDDKIMSGTAMSPQRMAMLSDLSKSIGSGTVSQADMQKTIEQMSPELKGDPAKQMAAQMSSDAGSDKDAALLLLKRSTVSSLDTMGANSSISDNGKAGSILDPKTQQAMLDAFQASSTASKQLAELSDHFDMKSLTELQKHVDAVTTAMGGGGVAGKTIGDFADGNGGIKVTVTSLPPGQAVAQQAIPIGKPALNTENAPPEKKTP